MSRCDKADLLILDDLGQEKVSDWVRDRLYRIISNRWNSGKKTIFTSNYSVDKLKETVGEAVHSRVKGDSLELLFKVQKDRRQKV